MAVGHPGFARTPTASLAYIGPAMVTASLPGHARPAGGARCKMTIECTAACAAGVSVVGAAPIELPMLAAARCERPIVDVVLVGRDISSSICVLAIEHHAAANRC